MDSFDMINLMFSIQSEMRRHDDESEAIIEMSWCEGPDILTVTTREGTYKCNAGGVCWKE